MRIPISQYERIAATAKVQGISVSEYIRLLITDKIGEAVTIPNKEWKAFFWEFMHIPETKLRYAFYASEKVEDFLMLLPRWNSSLRFNFFGAETHVTIGESKIIVPFQANVDKVEIYKFVDAFRGIYESELNKKIGKA